MRTLWGCCPGTCCSSFSRRRRPPAGPGTSAGRAILEQYRVDRIFGMHLWPGLPAGTVATGPGPMMARAGEVNVTVRGKSVHISSYRQGCDALAAAAEFLRRAYDMAAAMPSEEPLVLRFGKMTSGTVRNAVSALSVLEGNLRTYRDEVFDACCRGMEQIGAQVERETGCSVEVKLGISYPAVWNHEALLESVRRQLGSEAPVVLDTPAMAAEDFSFYQRQVPGVFFFLGTAPRRRSMRRISILTMKRCCLPVRHFLKSCWGFPEKLR